MVTKPTGTPKGGVRRNFTDEQRNQVEVLSGLGLPQTQIATLIGCDPKTLREHFREVLDVGDAKATAKVAQALITKALSGDTACMIFWMKARAGWKETGRIEVSGPDGAAVQIEAVRERIAGRFARLAPAAGVGGATGQPDPE